VLPRRTTHRSSTEAGQQLVDDMQFWVFKRISEATARSRPGGNAAWVIRLTAPVALGRQHLCRA
jgi:hypothetical protein